jgi:hypothetical protein
MDYKNVGSSIGHKRNNSSLLALGLFATCLTLFGSISLFDVTPGSIPRHPGAATEVSTTLSGSCTWGKSITAVVGVFVMMWVVQKRQQSSMSTWRKRLLRKMMFAGSLRCSTQVGCTKIPNSPGARVAPRIIALTPVAAPRASNRASIDYANVVGGTSAV